LDEELFKQSIISNCDTISAVPEADVGIRPPLVAIINAAATERLRLEWPVLLSFSKKCLDI
jgi:hypothetical protein